MSLPVELATEASSSTIKTSGDSVVFDFGTTGLSDNLEAFRGEIPLSLGTGLAVSGSPPTQSVKLLCHFDQIRERLRLHLLHDVRTMKFDSSFGGGQFAGNLLVHQP